MWAQCTRGVNCPWWVNPMKAESCTTGPSVSSCFMRILILLHVVLLAFIFSHTHPRMCVLSRPVCVYI